MSKYKLLLISAFSLLLTQCADTPKEELKEGASLSAIYNRAMESMLSGKDFKKAAKQFEDVERQHPFSPWAQKAQLMSAYAYYEADKYEDALANLESFLLLKPNHQYAAYAHYLMAMCYYVQLSGVNRDQEMTYKALAAFKNLLKKYPKSKYARDAHFKIDLCKEHLAGQDMEIGRFYQTSSLPIAALDRFTNVIQNYQTTSHTPEALHRMVEVMLTLSMTKQALVTASVLGYNYPGNRWYEYTYELLQQQGLAKEHDAKMAKPE